MQWKPADLAYLAGFLDGEGTFTVYRRQHPKQLHTISYSAVMTAASNDKAIIEWVTTTFGGGRSAIKRKPGFEQAYHWRLATKPDLITLIPQLLPYLKIKNLQARLLLEYCRKFTHNRGSKVSALEHNLRVGYCDMLTALNCKGEGSANTKARMLRIVEAGVRP